MNVVWFVGGVGGIYDFFSMVVIIVIDVGVCV